jgi:hypothetical protein
MAEQLASCRHCVERIRGTWPRFLQARKERLQQQERYGAAAEKVAENILEDLFTVVLDWSLGDLNNQVGYADLLLTRLGIKYLIVEVKRPGSLAWHRHAVDAALQQAMRYASEQKVCCVGVSDGVMLYAADFRNGGLQARVFASLDGPDPPESLWWLSTQGIYRACTAPQAAALRLLPEQPVAAAPGTAAGDSNLLHPKYRIPASCFAYVGDANDPKTWKLPYLLAGGNVDTSRLPKAIQAILTNYRGANVSRSSIPEEAIPDVLVRLGRAAASLGHMPHQGADAAPVYHELAEKLEQKGRLQE